MSGNFAFPSDDTDEPEYDEHEMLGPDALLFKKFSSLWPTTPQASSKHSGARRETCPICVGAGWLWVLPPPPPKGGS